MAVRLFFFFVFTLPHTFYPSVTFGLVFPPTSSTGDTATEFVAEILAPISTGWVGMLNLVIP